MLPTGKTMHLHRVRNCGNVQAAISKGQELGLKAINLKVADGVYLYAHVAETVKALKQAGYLVGGWQYCYGGVVWDRTEGVYKPLAGNTPEKEAAIARQAIETLQLDYFEIDAEGEWKQNLPGLPAKEQRAKQYMETLKASQLSIPVGLTTYRFPALHKEFPFKEFMIGGIQYVAPQVYWQQPATNRGPVRETEICFEQYSALLQAYGIALVFAPIGRCYIGDGYPLPGSDYEETTQFLQTAQNLEAEFVSFWALDYLFLETHAANQEERAQAIADYNWAGEAPPPFEPTWVTVDVEGSYAYLRPQAMAGTGQPYSGIVYDGKQLLKMGEVVNEKGEKWALVAGYVADWLLK